VEGKATGTTVYSGGNQTVGPPGTAVSTTVSSAGVQYVFGGGSAANTTVTGADAVQFVNDSAIAISTRLVSGGYQSVYAGGTAIATIDYTIQNVSLSGVAISTTLHLGFQDVFSAGTALLTTLSGGLQQVSLSSYSTGDFRLSSGVSGTVEISDPMVVGGGSVGASSAAMVWLWNGVDLPGVADGARTTLVGITDAGKTIGSPPAAAHAAAIALLGNYMAASFVDLAQPQAGASVMESEAVQQPRVTSPHR
jgi:autotransporter passenger strand-loop-strand repeat protein